MGVCLPESRQIRFRSCAPGPPNSGPADAGRGEEDLVQCSTWPTIRIGGEGLDSQAGGRLALVLIGQEERSDGAVPFGDDPELFARPEAVSREGSRIILEGVVVRAPVLRAELAPIPALVTAQIPVTGLVSRHESCQGIRSGNRSLKGKNGTRPLRGRNLLKRPLSLLLVHGEAG